jgi:hypothetical protein
MKTATKKIIGAMALVLSGGILAVGSISYADAGGKQSSEAVASVARFSGTPNYCQAFLGTQNVGTDGVSADFSAALGESIQANGGDVQRTYSMIREKCSAVV